MSETREQMFARLHRQMKLREELNEHVSAAILKLQMLGLTPENGMVELPVPEGIHPMRWKAVVKSAFRQGIPE